MPGRYLKPNTGPRQPCRRFPGGMFAHIALPSAILGLWGPLAVAADSPEPALRLARTLSVPAADFPAEERALLRVEYRAAQSRQHEADVVGDIILRVRRIDGMINDIHGVVATWPGAGSMPAPTRPAPPAPAASSLAPPASAKPASLPAAGEATPNTTVALRALMASVIIFLFWLLGKRHNYIKAQRLRTVAAATTATEATTPPVTPAGDAFVTVPPPAELEPAPIGATSPHSAASGSALPEPHHVAAPATVMAAKTITAEPAPLEFEFVAPVPAADAVKEPASPRLDTSTDQSLELAEIMVSMGLAQGAADTLTERIRDNPRRALFHWLKLLDVYRHAQMKDDFERAAQELRQAFNVQPAGWVAGPGGISIEDFPHLVDKLLALWPTPECAAFLDGLLADNRGGTRNGLPQSVAEEILLLERILTAEAAA